MHQHRISRSLHLIAITAGALALAACAASAPGDMPECGNGVREVAEECDDGNLAPGDGCDGSCRVEATGGECGDGTRDDGEECDDGNTAPGDGCDGSCRVEPAGPACGNGVREVGEECDDGNTTSGDGCDSSCQFESGSCGDGTLNAGEECDDGNTVPGDGCDADCRLEGPTCGDGDVEAGEECDDGNTVNDDGCSAMCKREFCGDGIVHTGEECDDGNGLNGDGCDSDCAVEGDPACGNDILEAGEECDDGNTTAGDGCDSDCKLEATGLCTPDWNLSCGDTDSWNTAFSGSTDRIDDYSCVGWNETGREYTYTFVAPSASDVTLTLTGTSADLDLFVLGEGVAGECDQSNCLEFGDDSVTFTTIPGHTYFIVVDGYLGAESPYSIHVSCGVCGDGNVDPDEQCDDGNTTAGDGCSDTCALEACGNGVVDAGEQCDEGDTDACDGCSATCQLETCGNFVVECDEECDDGGTIAGDGCSDTCALEGATCEPDYLLVCGESDSYSTLFAGATDAIDHYSCTSWSETGPEYAYMFTAPASGDVTVTLSGTSVDLDVFVLSDPADACVSSNCITYGNTAATFAAVAGETYYVVVDGYAGAEGSYTLTVSCGGGVCGDGVVQAGEQCDDGGTVPEDGCSATCQIERCGDGVVQAGLGEECDDGNTTSGDGCTETCQSEAGACVPGLTLACSTDDTWATDSPGATDMIDGYGCNTWDESGPEYAYEYVAVSDTTVTATVTSAVDLDVFVIADPGDGSCDPELECLAAGDDSATFDTVAGRRYYIVVDGFMGAVGTYTLALSCTAATTCGNDVLEPGEECDDGGTADGDGCSSTCELEGGTCTVDFTVGCGSSDAWSTTGPGSTDRIDRYACVDWNETGREYTYLFTTPADSDVTVTLAPDGSADLDVFVLLDAGGGCVAGNCVAHGDTGATFTATGGTSYYVVVDGFGGDEGSYTIDFGCSTPAAE